ncbi:hypothetical protein BT63DRAFT_425750 [Microthyrium microscopicum]|uniref:Uncharacterized protein n=1 Tax=Microthyrium microscopicum TaxID=703497 RepID=A0A6A6U8Y1_9PEZI|nr:hypothetical protein BT63DRAFT_425750 [Microthyrium microscopicum]
MTTGTDVNCPPRFNKQVSEQIISIAGLSITGTAYLYSARGSDDRPCYTAIDEYFHGSE